MFTGIIERTGRVVAIEQREGGRRLLVEAGELADALEVGASVAVDGACVTVTERGDGRFAVDLMGPTLDRTIAAGYAPGTPVNLERPLALGGRLDGHLVQGHVDGVGTLLEVTERGEDHLMDFRLPTEVAALTILHGSVALNGVSLTVSELMDADVCRIGVIPHTWRNTNLGALSPGDPVNVEGDLIGKYVGKMLARGTT